ncbi:hypothetical protein AUP68_03880 [Ilyonectria robusta]
MQDRELLQDTLYLWVASRLIEKPWRVVDNEGNETLEHDLSDNIHPFWDEESPFFSRVPVTPVMDNQLDQIIIKGILLPRKKTIQKRLHAIVKSNKPSNWFLVYLCTFLLLNNYEIATSHDRNFASRHSLKTRFSNYPLLEGFHAGANTLLAHFHYCCKGDTPFKIDWTKDPYVKSLTLNKEQRDYMQEISSISTSKGDSWKALKGSGEYDAEVYFISQMFDSKWKPSEFLH